MNDIQLDGRGLVLCKSTEVTFGRCVRTVYTDHSHSCPVNIGGLLHGSWSFASNVLF